MAQFLKKRIPQDVTDALDLKVRQTVESILTDVKKRGDDAVRELSQQFDQWSPPDFKLSQGELDTIMAKVPQSTIDDIKFAQAGYRNCRGRDDGYPSPPAQIRTGRIAAYGSCRK